jgi:hypothetical protein
MSEATRPGTVASLSADCGSCVGLCCVALAFSRSADFAFDKDAGEPCTNLDESHGCRVHPQLRERGLKGCTVFDCFGAGQRVTQRTFSGRSWRESPELGRQMFTVFGVVRQLHEVLWYLRQAVQLPQAQPLRAELQAAYDEIERVTGRPAEEILAVDVAPYREAANALLARVSERVRAEAAARVPEHPAGSRRIRSGGDLLGARLAGADLRGADLRGACLIAADLTRADLGGADVIGADLRDADLGGADLSEALFLTQMQVDAARGDRETRLPLSLHRPAHWQGAGNRPPGPS